MSLSIFWHVPRGDGFELICDKVDWKPVLSITVIGIYEQEDPIVMKIILAWFKRFQAPNPIFTEKRIWRSHNKLLISELSSAGISGIGVVGGCL
jgi:hypothetical protein